MGNTQLLENIGDYRNGFIENTFGGTPVKIHYIEKGQQDTTHVPVVASLGLWEPAERAIPLFDGLDGHCVSLSYRGRGQSETPKEGYDLQHHVSDLASVIDGLALQSCVLVAFSRGVGYACGYAALHPERIKGMILVDYPAIHTRPPSGYAAFWKKMVYLGLPITQYIRPEALDGIEKEAQNATFWDVMGNWNFPITVLRGTNVESPIASNVTNEDIAQYRISAPNCQEIEFSYSGHMIVDEELGKYRSVVQEFLNQIN